MWKQQTGPYLCLCRVARRRPRRQPCGASSDAPQHSCTGDNEATLGADAGTGGAVHCDRDSEQSLAGPATPGLWLANRGI